MNKNQANRNYWTRKLPRNRFLMTSFLTFFGKFEMWLLVLELLKPVVLVENIRKNCNRTVFSSVCEKVRS